MHFEKERGKIYQYKVRYESWKLALLMGSQIVLPICVTMFEQTVLHGQYSPGIREVSCLCTPY